MNPTSYTVNHLFLLMGENPLPNLVAAMSLLEVDGTPYLIHTTHTRLQAERLADVLKSLPYLQPSRLINLGNNQAEAFTIGQKIRAIAQSLTGQIGLNYTGGTKAMSVHAYRVIAALYPKGVFSYLDSNTLEMMIDDDHAPSPRYKIPLKLSFEQLFRLHGLQWRQDCPPLKVPIHAIAATQFAKLCATPDLRRAWRHWCDQELRRKCQTAYDRWQKEWQLAQLPPLSLNGMPVRFQQLLQQHFGAGTQQFSLQTAQQANFLTITRLCEWLDGVWLEDYVLQQVQQIQQALDIHECRMSFRMQEPTDHNAQFDKFEFDVAFIRHYQLFALSCTTSESRKLCKQKLIEANTRARQLGGTEARVALVCARSDPESLRKELEVATRNRKIAVFGRQDWSNLSAKIMQWVKQND
ncbi:MAG: DUF1887 family CARF protein [Leptolyngbyaceae cyanobacterium bins.59]|nr:DUF1887 family CARF protein [Leptolyngbyaceae cyanobacterium bins.59]